MKIKVVAKCSDCCSVSVEGTDLQKQGYVPRDLGIGGGDYIRFTIDSVTGKIEGWSSRSKAELTDLLS
jgi:hypothetical protein